TCSGESTVARVVLCGRISGGFKVDTLALISSATLQKGDSFMKSQQLLDDLEFHQSVPFAQPLFVRSDGRILRWMLKPGQQIREHSVPHSPFYVVVLKGHGMF